MHTVLGGIRFLATVGHWRAGVTSLTHPLHHHQDATATCAVMDKLEENHTGISSVARCRHAIDASAAPRQHATLIATCAVIDTCPPRKPQWHFLCMPFLCHCHIDLCNLLGKHVCEMPAVPGQHFVPCMASGFAWLVHCLMRVR